MYIEIDSKDFFLAKINKYKNDSKYIFRGQVEDHPTFCTSFERKKCIPREKAKWDFYCYNAFKMILSSETYETMPRKAMMIYVDSLLQHYGWRSMQLDVSKNIDVSAFFACFDYIGKNQYQLTEDYNESPVMERISTAEYRESSREYGYIYIFDLNQIKDTSTITFTDLTNGLIDSNCRPVRQSGCVISSFPSPIDKEISPCLVEILKVKSSVLLDYCKEKTINEIVLFPPASEDYIYSFLLSLPSKEFVKDDQEHTGIYLKELDIPEYHYKFNKIQSPAKAYYSTLWILDSFTLYKSELNKKTANDFVYYKCLSHDFFHYFSKEGQYLQMPHFIEFIRKNNSVVLEFNNIFRHYASSLTEYQKGIRFLLEGDLLTVHEIFIDWAGKQANGFGELAPRFFQIISDNEVIPIRKEGDCPCNDDDRHLHRLLVGKYFSQMIAEGYLSVKKDSNNVYIVS